MLDINQPIKQLAAVIRKEIKATEDLFALRCRQVSDMVARDLTIKREDVQQRAYDLCKILEEDVYGPHISALNKMLREINKFKQKDGA